MHALGLLSLIAGYPDSVVITELVLGVVFAVLGYVASERYRRRRGVTPWRLPSAVWALLLFFLLLIGVLLYLIACSTTRPRTNDWAGGPPGWSSDPRSAAGPPPDGWNAPTPGGWGPSPPQGWDAPPPPGWGQPPGAQAPGPTGQAPAPGGWGAPAPPAGWGAPPPGGWDAPPPPGTVFPTLDPTASPSSGPLAPASPPPPRSWLPDPGGRHELRYWDGTKFTEHVADSGKISTDPL